MSKWRIEFKEEAEHDLAGLNTSVRQRVIQKLDWLKENFDYLVPLPLGSEWKGFFKLRVGDRRAIYEIKYNKETIVVHLIDRRDKIYKRVIKR